MSQAVGGPATDMRLPWGTSMLTQTRNFWRQYVRSLFSRSSVTSLRTVKRQRRLTRLGSAQVLEARALLAAFTGLGGTTTATTGATAVTIASGFTMTVANQNDVYKATPAPAQPGIFTMSVTAGGQAGDLVTLPTGVLGATAYTVQAGGNIVQTATPANIVGSYTTTATSVTFTFGANGWANTGGNVTGTGGFLTALGRALTFSTTSATAGNRTFTYAYNSFAGAATGTGTQTLSVNPNNAPTGITLSANSVAENAGTNVAVGTFSTTDIDAGNTFTYALVAGTGSTDNAAFTLNPSTGALTLNASADLEAKPSYSIRVQTTDNSGATFQQAFTINVTNVNEAPTAVSLSSSSVNEGLAVNSVVGTITGTDPDAGTSLTFSVSGTDAARFNVFNNAGTWQLRTSEVFDYETQDPFSIILTATDGGSLTFSQPFTISILNVNEAPTDISLAPTALAENNAIGDDVGTLSTSDPDTRPATPQTFTYTLVSGTGSTDNSAFSISGSSLKAAVVFNYEAKSSYSVRVRSTDQDGASTEKAFTVTITDVDEAPTWVTSPSGSTAENTTAVANLSATDPEGQVVTYTIITPSTPGGYTPGPDYAQFTLVGNVLSFNTAPDYEVPTDDGGQNIYDIHLLATDVNGHSTFLELQVSVTAVNDNTPAFTTSATLQVNENQTNVATLAASDADLPAQSLTYTITGGADADKFNLSTGGVLTFKTAPDRETPTDSNTDNIYEVTVQVSDGTLTDSRAFAVTVNDINEFGVTIIDPQETSGQNAEIHISEGYVLNGANFVYQIVAQDGDLAASGTIYYELYGNSPTRNLFQIGQTSGILSWVNPSDYESQGGSGPDKNLYAIQIRAYDPNDGTNGHDDILNLNVIVDGIDDTAPTITTNSNQTYAENGASMVFNVSLTDPDIGGGGHTYSIVSVADGGSVDAARFTIGANGDLQFVSSPDYENPLDADADNFYLVTIRAQDTGGLQLSTDKNFVIEVTDVNEAPVISQGNVAVSENFVGTALTVAATDPEGDTLTYSISGGLDAGKFSINASTGAISFNVSPNFEAPTDNGTNNIYDLTVSVSDGTNTTSKAIEITVNNVNENPVFSPTTRSINYAENATSDVATIVATDADAGDVLSYQLANLDDSALFSITNAGVLTWDFSPDYETPAQSGGTANVYSVEVWATDLGGLTAAQTVTITVTPVNEAATDISLSNSAVDENEVSGSSVGTLSTNDPDTGDTLTYSLVSGTGDTDNAQFTIDGTTLKTNASFDYETKNSYSIRVKVEDLAGLSHEKQFTITVNDVQEGTLPPVAVNFPELQTGVATTIDNTTRNFAGPYTFALAGGADDALFTVDATTGAVTPIAALDFETVTDANSDDVYEVWVRVTSASNPTGVIIPLQITVTDANDPLVIATTTVVTLGWTEDTGAQVIDANLSLSDQDSPVTSLANGRVWIWIGNSKTGDQFVLSTNNADNVYLSGSDITVGGVVIGTLQNGTSFGQNTVDIALSADATKANVETFLRAVEFNNPTGAYDSRQVDVHVKVYDTQLVRSNEYIATLDITATPDQPVIASTRITYETYYENGAPRSIDSSLWLSDVDLPTSWTGYTITAAITNAKTGDALTVTGTVDGVTAAAGLISDSSGQIGTYTIDGSGQSLTITMTGGDSARLLRLIAFSSSSDTLDATVRTIDVTVDDGASTAVTRTVSLTPIAVNDRPVATASGVTPNYTEDSGVVTVFSGSQTISVSDLDHSNFAGGKLTATISQNASSLDSLSIANQGTGAGQIGFDGTTVTYEGTDIGTFSRLNYQITVDFNANATPTAVAALISQITLESLRQYAPPGALQVLIQVSDGLEFGNTPLTATVNFTAENDLVVLETGLKTSATFAEGGAAVQLGPTMSVTDPDLPVTGSLGGRSLVVSLANATAEDVLGIRTQGTNAGQINVSGNNIYCGSTLIGTIDSNEIDGSNLVLTITLENGATQAFVSNLLKVITFSNTSDNPGTTPRTVTWTISDPEGASSSKSTTIGIAAINDVPVVTTSDNTTNAAGAFTENGSVVIVDNQFSFSDVDNSTFAGGQLRVRIALNATSFDSLVIVPNSDVTVSGNTVSYQGTAVGTFTGGVSTNALVVSFNSNSATTAAVIAIARAIGFTNSSDSPTTLSRQIAFDIFDGQTWNSTSIARIVGLNSVNDDPTIRLGSISASFRENTTYILADSGTVADPDNAFFNNGVLTVKLAVNGHADDRLGIANLGLLTRDTEAKTVSYNGVKIADYTGGTVDADLVITLNGSASLAAVQALYKAISFTNVSDNPTTATRTINYLLTDGSGGTATASKTIAIVAVNDASVFTGLASVTYTVGTAGTLIASAGSVGDVDSVDFAGGSLTATFSAGLQSGDKISLLSVPGSSIAVDGGLHIDQTNRRVYYNGVQFATFSGGTGSTAFVLTFNSNANTGNVTAVLQRLYFSTTSTSTTARTIRLTMKDGDGGSTIANISLTVFQS